MDGISCTALQGYQAKNIVLLGDSAGGGLVAAVTIQLQRESIPLPAALGMFSPYADPDPSIPFDTKSTLIAIDPIFSPIRPGFPTLGSQYVGGNSAEFQNPLVSPRRADWARLFPNGMLPPTLIQVSCFSQQTFVLGPSNACVSLLEDSRGPMCLSPNAVAK